MSGLTVFPFFRLKEESTVTHMPRRTWHACMGLLWLTLGFGFPLAVIWFMAGIVLTVTIVGIPFGHECFKIARMYINPMDISVRRSAICGPCGCDIPCNILWLLLVGWEMLIIHLVLAIIWAPFALCMLPFSGIHLKLARLSLLPFGTKLAHKHH